MSTALAGQDPDVRDDSDLDVIEALMSEAPAAGNHGRKATNRTPTTSPDKDGERWGDSHRSLNAETHASVQFVAGGGATVVTEDWGHFHGLVSHLHPTDGGRTLSRKELDVLDAEQVRALALEGLGFTADEMAILDKPGGMSNPAKRALQDRFDDRLLEVQEAGGRTTDLARALGWTLLRAGSCTRMRKSVRRARARRDAALQA